VPKECGRGYGRDVGGVVVLFDSLEMSGSNSIVVFDTEFTSWPGAMERGWSGPDEHREIVQIGAVRLDSGLSVTASLDLIIRPSINPILSEYFVHLTGLTQERVERDGCSFADALAGFERFLADSLASVVAYSNGSDDSVLLENLELNDLNRPLPAVNFMDIQPWFQTALACQGTPIASGDLLGRIGAQDRFPSHDAVGDATSIAVAIRYLKAKGAPPLPHEILPPPRK
jgi:inhibitor of KinA sporulation pathway (predicted exonuclease)